jgi:hypothetical protein
MFRPCFQPLVSSNVNLRRETRSTTGETPVPPIQRSSLNATVASGGK